MKEITPNHAGFFSLKAYSREKAINEIFTGTKNTCKQKEWF